MKIKVKKVEPYVESIKLPAHQTEGSAGMDLYAQEDWCIPPFQVGVVRTGISIELPVGFEAQVRSRSGLAAKQQVFVLNSPGTIDSDYRGEVKVILFNAGPWEVMINKGDRIAQMVVARYERVELVEGELSETERGSGGFGSTGV